MNNLLNRTVTNPISGEKVTFICTAAETKGLKSVIEIELQPKGEGLPPHYHKAYSETFRILEGEVSLQIGEKFKITQNELIKKYCRSIKNNKYNTAYNDQAG